MLAKLMDGSLPAIEDILYVHFAILENLDIYQPVDIASQIHLSSKLDVRRGPRSEAPLSHPVVHQALRRADRMLDQEPPRICNPVPPGLSSRHDFIFHSLSISSSPPTLSPPPSPLLSSSVSPCRKT